MASSVWTDSTARFSPCRTWRYLLTRNWNVHRPPLLAIGLNPSTADESVDDPTIRRLIGFATRWGYGSLRMLNLFAFRSTDPKGLRRCSDPIGPENDEVIAEEVLAHDVLCCWGAHGSLMQRDLVVRAIMAKTPCRPFHLGLTKHGHPKHPLYLRADVTPQEFKRG